MRRGTKGRLFRRHLDGWQAGVLVLVIAGSAILLGFPRAAVPDALPEVRVDRAALAAAAHADDERAAAAEETRLDVDIRAVGSEMRAYNRAAFEDDDRKLVAARDRMGLAAQTAVKRSPEELASLRAFQLKRFLGELDRWRQSGTISDELAELSGDLVAALARNRWCRAGGERELVADEHVLRVLWKKRWNEIVGVRGPLFDLSADEDRLRYGFLVQHPFLRRADVRRRGQAADRLDELLAQKARLAAIDRLAQLDPGYPGAFARGIVLFQMGDFADAATSFRSHLDQHPDGAYTLRARNYLKAALDLTAESSM